MITALSLSCKAPHNISADEAVWLFTSTTNGTAGANAATEIEVIVGLEPAEAN